MNKFYFLPLCAGIMVPYLFVFFVILWDGSITLYENNLFILAFEVIIGLFCFFYLMYLFFTELDKKL